MAGHEQDGFRHLAGVHGAHRVRGDLRHGVGQASLARPDANGQHQGGELLPHLPALQADPEVGGEQRANGRRFRSLLLPGPCHEGSAG